MKPLFLIFALASTANAQTEDFNRCRASPDKATVYFYRVHEHIALQKGHTRLRINNTKVAQIPKGSYLGIYLKAATYVFSLGVAETDFPLKAEAGKIYFFMVSHTYYNGIALSSKQEEQAAYQMKALKPLAGDNITDNTLERCDQPLEVNSKD